MVHEIYARALIQSCLESLLSEGNSSRTEEIVWLRISEGTDELHGFYKDLPEISFQSGLTGVFPNNDLRLISLERWSLP
jgi:hypothetical protein